MDRAFVAAAVQAFLEYRKPAAVGGQVVRYDDKSRQCCWELASFLEALDDAMSRCEPLRGELFGD